MKYVLNNGFVVPNDEDPINSCSKWQNNWILNILDNAICDKDHLAVNCDVELSLFPALRSMARRHTVFSVMGFMAKFKKICIKRTPIVSIR